MTNVAVVFLFENMKNTTELKQCPCGKIPGKLVIVVENLQKWSFACGNCCHDWHIEFRSDYAIGDELMEKAIEAWNNTCRAVL